MIYGQSIELWFIGLGALETNVNVQKIVTNAERPYEKSRWS